MEQASLMGSWNQSGKDTDDMTAHGEMLRGFEAELKQIHRLDDPIVPYLKQLEYVKLINSSRELLIEVLQKCTHDFKDDEIYKDDVRYLRIWLQYIEFSNSRYEIYIYLFKKSIGSKLGLYYQSFCNFLEQIGDYQKCFEVYQYACNRSFIRNWHSLNENFENFKQRLINYEKFSGAIDKSAPSFLLSVKPRDSSLDANELSHKRKKTKTSSESSLYCSPYQIVKVEGKPDEKWKINLKAIYSESGEEFTPEEIMCIERGIYDLKPVNIKRQEKKKGLVPRTTTVTVPLKDITESTTKNNQQDHRDTGIAKIFDSEISVRPSSPTMTMLTKQANEEIMNIFNQPIQDTSNESAAEPTPVKEKKGFQVKIDNEDDHMEQTDSVEEEVLREPQTPPNKKTNVVSGNSNSVRRTNLVPFMTPIAELTENSTQTSNLMSSPFIEEPDQALVKPLIEPIDSVINPLDDNIRSTILKNLAIPLSRYGDYNVYNSEKNSLSVFKAYFTSSSKKSAVGNKNSMIEFDNELYCVRKQLGEGGYATVYLAESSNGTLDAIKIEKPANPWEFYILKQIEKRIPGLKSCIQAKGLNMFKDEGFLILEYLNQGTLLDLVNHYKTNGEQMPEKLIMHVMAELITTVNALHANGIIHGDLKPDNCMLSITTTSFLKIIDFGRSIDMSVLPSDIRFKSTWDTDHQDCPEMRHNRTWVHEVDYFGLANIAHTLLFQEIIEIVKSADGYKLKNSLKRYWNPVWQDMFTILLNTNKQQLSSSQEKLDKIKQRLDSELKGSQNELARSIENIKGTYSI